MLNGLDLFSGIGGMSIALQDYVYPIAFCEIDSYCQGVLLNQMANNNLCRAPIWDDIRTLHRQYGSFPDSSIDIIYGGFPCQDISVAGNGKGLEGERSGLFFEIMRLAKEIQPTFIFLENVPAITTRGGIQVVESITEMGYDCRWCIISAASIGALHRRERWFLLAHANNNGSSSCENRGSSRECSIQGKESDESKENNRETQRTSRISSNVAHSSSERLERFREGEISPESTQSLLTSSSSNYTTIREWQEAVSSICRTSDGIPNRMDRIKCLGNSVVPKQAKEAFEILMGLK